MPKETKSKPAKPTVELKQHKLVTHRHGATIAFHPIGGSHVQIMLGKQISVDKKPRFHRHQELGPWGDFSDDKDVDRKSNWKEHEEAAKAEAYKAIQFLEGNLPGWWKGDPPIDKGNFLSQPETENQEGGAESQE